MALETPLLQHPEPARSKLESIRLSILSNPNIPTGFAILCGAGAAASFLDTSSFASLSERVGRVTAAGVVLSVLLMWVVFACFAKKLRGRLIQRENPVGDATVIKVMLLLSVALVVLYKAHGSAVMTFFLVGCVNGWANATWFTVPNGFTKIAPPISTVAWEQWGPSKEYWMTIAGVGVCILFEDWLQGRV